jgi:uncharacterized protein DUF6152
MKPRISAVSLGERLPDVGRDFSPGIRAGLKTRTAFVLLFVLIASVGVRAHHSFAAFYNEDQSVSVQGTIIELAYKNPHAWVHFDARDNDGKVQRIGAEWANPGRLAQQGILQDTLKPGDHVIITGSPSRNPSELKMHLKGIVRVSDGWKWAGRTGGR